MYLSGKLGEGNQTCLAQLHLRYSGTQPSYKTESPLLHTVTPTWADLDNAGRPALVQHFLSLCNAGAWYWQSPFTIPRKGPPTQPLMNKSDHLLSIAAVYFFLNLLRTWTVKRCGSFCFIPFFHPKVLHTYIGSVLKFCHKQRPSSSSICSHSPKPQLFSPFSLSIPYSYIHGSLAQSFVYVLVSCAHFKPPFPSQLIWQPDSVHFNFGEESTRPRTSLQGSQMALHLP